jgi:hypothetical protein
VFSLSADTMTSDVGNPNPAVLRGTLEAFIIASPLLSAAHNLRQLSSAYSWSAGRMTNDLADPNPAVPHGPLKGFLTGSPFEFSSRDLEAQYRLYHSAHVWASASRNMFIVCLLSALVAYGLPTWQPISTAIVCVSTMAVAALTLWVPAVYQRSWQVGAAMWKLMGHS